jgi:hypothetical protein
LNWSCKRDSLVAVKSGIVPVRLLLYKKIESVLTRRKRGLAREPETTHKKSAPKERNNGRRTEIGQGA